MKMGGCETSGSLLQALRPLFSDWRGSASAREAVRQLKMGCSADGQPQASGSEGYGDHYGYCTSSSTCARCRYQHLALRSLHGLRGCGRLHRGSGVRPVLRRECPPRMRYGQQFGARNTSTASLKTLLPHEAKVRQRVVRSASLDPISQAQAA